MKTQHSTAVSTSFGYGDFKSWLENMRGERLCSEPGCFELASCLRVDEPPGVLCSAEEVERAKAENRAPHGAYWPGTTRQVCDDHWVAPPWAANTLAKEETR